MVDRLLMVDFFPVESLVAVLTIVSLHFPWQVSEPEKWGYPADWKKVVVYFFGTEQM